MFLQQKGVSVGRQAGRPGRGVEGVLRYEIELLIQPVVILVLVICTNPWLLELVHLLASLASRLMFSA